MSYPHYYNRSCGPCGCALEECECSERQVRELTTLAPVDELLSELDAEPDPILGHVPQRLQSVAVAVFAENNK